MFHENFNVVASEIAKFSVVLNVAAPSLAAVRMGQYGAGIQYHHLPKVYIQVVPSGDLLSQLTCFS
jgi:hypothetical protein